MNKQRHIDQAILRSESVSRLTFRQRDLWTRLILSVDDQGRCLGHPALIRSSVWPLEDISLEDVRLDLQQLEALDFIQGYEVGEKKYLQILKWQFYQRAAEWLGLSQYPAMEGWLDRFRYHGKGRQVVQSDNWNLKGGEEEVEAEESNRLPNELKLQIEDTKAERSPLPIEDVNDDGNENDEGKVEVDGDVNREVEGKRTARNAARVQKLPEVRLKHPAWIWERAIGDLRGEMPRADFETWIKPLQFRGFAGDRVEVVAINSFTRDWVMSRAKATLERVMSGLAGRDIALLVILQPEFAEMH